LHCAMVHLRVLEPRQWGCSVCRQHCTHKLDHASCSLAHAANTACAAEGTQIVRADWMVRPACAGGQPRVLRVAAPLVAAVCAQAHGVQAASDVARLEHRRLATLRQDTSACPQRTAGLHVHVPPKVRLRSHLHIHYVSAPACRTFALCCVVAPHVQAQSHIQCCSREAPPLAMQRPVSTTVMP